MEDALTIEVLSDPYAAALRHGDGKPFNPRIHRRFEPSWLLSLRRACKRPDLFTFIHERTGALVIACWVYPPGKPHPIGLMTELEVCEPLPDGGYNLPSLDYMISRCRPLEEQIGDMIRASLEAERAEQEAIRDNDRQRKDAARFLRRANLDREASAVENYETPYEDADPSILGL